MAYFSNGTEGINYAATFCDKCWHQKPDEGGCAVWNAHMLHNYKECNNEDSILKKGDECYIECVSPETNATMFILVRLSDGEIDLAYLHEIKAIAINDN